MLVVSPFWGILAARGWMWIFDSLKWRFPLRWAASPVMPLLANTAYPVVPLIYVADWLQARSLANWIEDTPPRRTFPKLLTAHPAISYFLNVSITDHTRSYEWTKTTIDAAPGTMMMWDSVYGVYNADTARSVKVDEIRNAGWIEMPLPIQDDQSHTWHVFLSPRTIAGSTTGRSRSPRMAMKHPSDVQLRRNMGVSPMLAIRHGRDARVTRCVSKTRAPRLPPRALIGAVDDAGDRESQLFDVASHGGNDVSDALHRQTLCNSDGGFVMRFHKRDICPPWADQLRITGRIFRCFVQATSIDHQPWSGR